MVIPITLLFTSIFAVFALVLSFRAGAARGKSGESVLYGSPTNMQLAEKVRAHQNFLEYVPIFLLMFAAIEANGGNTTFLYVTGSILVVARIAHAIGLRHDNMAHPGRFIGAAGTALTTLVVAGYGLWMVIRSM